jgi:hypothetical protein
MNAVDPLTQLRDIQGLDALPWWYIAPGWLLLFASFLFFIAILSYWQHRRRPSRTWPKQALRELNHLRKRLRQEAAKAVLSDFSELLRRIAIARFSRQECAGLYGEAWLEWLQRHDPQGFRWQDHGRVLLTLAYAPPTTAIDVAVVTPLLDAARYWLDPKNSPL